MGDTQNIAVNEVAVCEQNPEVFCQIVDVIFGTVSDISLEDFAINVVIFK